MKSILGGNMKLIQVQIENYRKFEREEINFEDNITVIAGSNNSGKTSLIDLFKTVFETNKNENYASYLPIKRATEWTNNFFDKFVQIFTDYPEQETRLNHLFNYIYCSIEDPTRNDQVIPSTAVKIHVEYDPEDDIQLFSDYLYSFDPSSTSIFLMYSLEPDKLIFKKTLSDNYDKLDRRFISIRKNEVEGNEEMKEINTKASKGLLFTSYTSSLLEHYYYTDENFNLSFHIEERKFKKLFHFKNIYASRPLDDQDHSNSKNLSKRIIELAGFDDDWNDVMKELPDSLLHKIVETNSRDIVRGASSSSLDDAISEASKINGMHAATMTLDVDVNESHVRKLMDQIITAKFILDDHTFGESSQGLGYSNMLFILLQLETYKRSIDERRLNFFIIEEPESHMHPQMQVVFSKYLKTYYESINIQGLITTHSNEIIRATSINALRVVRPLSPFQSKIYDLSVFNNTIGEAGLKDFYNFFYEIGFSEIVFSDRVILHEGDTERLMIRKIASFEEYKDLDYLYIAFVQVGGAYALKYYKLLEFLKVKTLILTDLDYKKEELTRQSVLTSKTTNESLIWFYNKDLGRKSVPNVQELIEWAETGDNVLLDGVIRVEFQRDREAYARTLEEAMLSKKLGIDVFETKDNNYWKAKREEFNLAFSIPNKNENISIRDIVKSTGRKKTDFMYSVIINENLETMIPSYISEGLEWLLQ